MVHSRDDEEVGMAHEVKSPKNQPQFFPDYDGAGKTRPKQAFRSEVATMKNTDNSPYAMEAITCNHQINAFHCQQR